MELPSDMTMVDYEVMTSKSDFDDLLEGIDRKRSSRRLDLSLESCQPCLFKLDFSLESLGRILGFDSSRGHRPLSSWWDLSLARTKKPLGFHKKAMHLLWSSVVSSQIFGSKFFKVYQNLVTMFPFFGSFLSNPFFNHVKTHLWMTMMEFKIVIV
jgi:hypothetical protein